MARTKMSKIRVEKKEVNSCIICDLYDTVSRMADKTLEKAKEVYPDGKNFKYVWDVRENHTVPGFKITYYRPARKDDDDWRIENGLYQTGTSEICEKCYTKLTECFNKIGAAEEIAFATTESCKGIDPFRPEEFLNEEGEEV